MLYNTCLQTSATTSKKNTTCTATSCITTSYTDNACTTGASALNTLVGGGTCTVGTAVYGLTSSVYYKATVTAPVDVVETTVSTTRATGAMNLVASIAASGALMSTIY